MSTPPRVDLPAGVVVERWPVRERHIAVMRNSVIGAREWAILVPGFTGSKEDFVSVLPLLADVGIGALAYDQRGQYQSDASADPADYSLAALAADLASIVDLGADQLAWMNAPHLVGHSFGGLVAQCGLVDGDVRPSSFVALCTGPGALPRDRWSGLPDLVAALGDQSLDEIWTRMQEIDAANATPRAEPEVEAFLHSRWLANDPHQLREVAQALMTAPPMTDRMRAVVGAGLPMTVMWGERDYAWPVDHQRDWAADLGVPAVQIPGSGHSPNADDPASLVWHLIEAWRA
jgi:pimeloyl-ACP methyl ester carboxylesterase